MLSVRQFAAVLLVFAVLAPVTSASARDDDAQAFVSGIEDLPLMPGLTETQEGSLVFETASGRFVEVYAVGDLSPQEVTGFYGQSLPQLGWRQVGPTLFRRDAEILLIEYLDGSDEGSPLTVRFALSPSEN